MAKPQPLPNGTPLGIIVRAIREFGAMTVLAFLLTGALLGWLPGPMASHIDDMFSLHQRILGMQYATCLNVSKTDQEVKRCETWYFSSQFARPLP